MMNPEDMSEEQLLRELMHQEARRLVLHEAQAERAISPVEVPAPRVWVGPSEEVTWWVVVGVGAVLAVLCFLDMLR